MVAEALGKLLYGGTIRPAGARDATDAANNSTIQVRRIRIEVATWVREGRTIKPTPCRGAVKRPPASSNRRAMPITPVSVDPYPPSPDCTDQPAVAPRHRRHLLVGRQ